MVSKKERKYFSVFDYEKEQEYLRMMHRSGWKFVKVTGMGNYWFEPCQPEDVMYQLDYNQEGVKHKAEYIQMFQDCGWEYIQDFVGYSYFRKPVANGIKEEIFCDDESRLQMMNRVLKGRLLPSFFMFICFIYMEYMWFFVNESNVIRVAVTSPIFVIYIGLFTWYLVKYYQFKKKMK
jgi:hypothetical protein